MRYTSQLKFKKLQNVHLYLSQRIKKSGKLTNLEKKFDG